MFLRPLTLEFALENFEAIYSLNNQQLHIANKYEPSEICYDDQNCIEFFLIPIKYHGKKLTDSQCM